MAGNLLDLFYKDPKRLLPAQTLNPKPLPKNKTCTLNPKPYTLNPRF